MSKIENLFYNIDSKVEEIKKETHKNYLEVLSNYLAFQDDKDYFDLVDNYSKEEIKKVYQFLVLKSFKELNNINYSITPELISFYVKNLIELIYKNKKLDIVDLASGSGNLLLSLENINYNLASVDIDNDFVNLQKNIFNLLEKEVSIIHQDALKEIPLKKQDVVISDVPQGYYFDEDNSLNYKMCSKEGYSLNSLLFLEQAINYLKDDCGVSILILPKQIMELTDDLKNFLKDDININAFILLPEEIFKNKDQQKVIVLATRKTNTILPKNVFLAQLPSYKNKEGYEYFLNNFKSWIASV